MIPPPNFRKSAALGRRLWRLAKINVPSERADRRAVISIVVVGIPSLSQLLAALSTVLQRSDGLPIRHYPPSVYIYI